MALTILHERKRRIANGFMVSGIGQFSTTDTTGELPCLLNYLDKVDVKSLGPPAAAAGTFARALQSQMGAVSASAKANMIVPVAGTVASAAFVVTTTVATHASNIWTIGIVNTGQAGAGTAATVDITDATNSNNSTGGTAFTALTERALTLGSAGNLAVVAGDILVWTFTKASSAANLVDLALQVTVTESSTLGAEERVYVDEVSQVTGGVLVNPTTGTLTIARAGQSVTSGLMFSYEYIGH